MTALLLTAAFALNVPFFPQPKNGCGAASVAMVAHYWKPQLTQVPAAPEIYKHLPPNEHGIALSHMKSYLETLGLKAFTVKGTLQDLTTHTEKGRPVIVGLRKNQKAELHFVVITAVTANRIQLQDPSRSKPKHLTPAAFETQWAQGGNWALIAAP